MSAGRRNGAHREARFDCTPPSISTLECVPQENARIGVEAPDVGGGPPS
jgi:hypothetical protein